MAWEILTDTRCNRRSAACDTRGQVHAHASAPCAVLTRAFHRQTRCPCERARMLRAPWADLLNPFASSACNGHYIVTCDWWANTGIVENHQRERERGRGRGRAGGVSKFPNNIRPLRSDELLSIVSVNRPNFSRSSLTAMTRKKLFSPSLSLSLSRFGPLFVVAIVARDRRHKSSNFPDQSFCALPTAPFSFPFPPPAPFRFFCFRLLSFQTRTYLSLPGKFSIWKVSKVTHLSETREDIFV